MRQLPQRETLLGLEITPLPSTVPLLDMIDSAVAGDQTCTIVTFVNPHAVWLSEKNAAYRDALSKFDYVLCDGVGMVLAARWVLGTDTQRLSFDATSLAPVIFRRLAMLGGSAFLVGGRKGVAAAAGEKFKREWNVKLAGCEHGYVDDLSNLVELINRSEAKVVVCGMGAPKQEELLLQLQSSGWMGVGFTCGGFFDQTAVSGTDYYPAWIDRANLRFLYRLWKEPRRLWRRYLIEYSAFLLALIRALCRSRMPRHRRG